MEPTNPRPVMDIRPQRPVPPPIQRADFNTTAAAPAPAPTTIVNPTPAAQPEPPTPPEIPEEQHEVHQTPEHFPADLPRVKTPKAAIAIAILVGTSLIGLTVFAYMKTQDKDTATVATDSQTEAVEAATATDIDDELAETDAALQGLDEAADFNEADLSDDSLGL